MKKGYQYFLKLTETMRFKQAAQELYISQQGLSDQIKRLEQELGVQLFIRRPNLILTPAGDALKRMLGNLELIEKTLENELSDIREGRTGTISAGIHFARSRILLPGVMRRFSAEYPNVSVNLVSDETANYVSMLKNAKIDFFFGINADIHPELNYRSLVDESIFFVVPRWVLQKEFGERSAEIEERFKQGADLSMLIGVPFISAGSISHTQNVVDKYLAENELSVNPLVSCEDFPLHPSIADAVGGACFCPGSMLAGITLINQHRQNPFCVFPLKGLQNVIHLSIVTHKHGYLTKFTERFCQLLEAEIYSASFPT